MVRAIRQTEGLGIMLRVTRNVITNAGVAGAILLVVYIGVTAWAWWAMGF